MRSENPLHSYNPVSRLVQCSLLAALTAAATLIAIPIAGGHGYVNLGDAVIHFSVFALGGVYASASAAIGSMLADLITGYFIYAPASFLIKGLVALVGAKLIAHFKHPAPAFFISGLIMPLGYFLYEMLILSPAAALMDSVWNIIQYVACAAVGSAFAITLGGKRFKK